jgi:hypothetical protein
MIKFENLKIKAKNLNPKVYTLTLSLTNSHSH